jgi:hypothetical protein
MMRGGQSRVRGNSVLRHAELSDLSTSPATWWMNLRTKGEPLPQRKSTGPGSNARKDEGHTSDC